MDSSTAATEPKLPDLCRRPAHRIASDVAAGEVSATDVTETHLRTIAELNEQAGALVAIAADQARDSAQQIDERRAAGRELGPLAGVPFAVSDLQPTRGLRTTLGSKIYRNYLPRHDSLLVERLRAADAVIVGKSMTTAFGLGARQGQEVGPPPRNPRAPGRSAGDSGAGAAVAVASSMTPLADAPDLGGGGRVAAAFNGLVALRPTPGRIPTWPNDFAWDALSGQCLLARNVADLALAVRALAGPDERAPLSTATPLLEPAACELRKRRLLWTPDFGRWTVPKEILAPCESLLDRVEALGSHVGEEMAPFDKVDETFQILQSWTFAQRHQNDLHRHRQDLHPSIAEAIEEGLKLNGLVIARAEMMRSKIYGALREIFAEHDFLVAPATQALPAALDSSSRPAHDGSAAAFFGSMPICYPASLAGLPSVTLPCGTSDDGLPVALQVLGRYGADADVLTFAAQLEQLVNPSVVGDEATI